MEPSLFILIILTVIGAVIYFSWQVEKKRTKAIKEIASRTGFGFSESRNFSLNDFGLMKKGYAGKAYNILEKTKDTIIWRIFDYQYTISSGRSSRTVYHTAIMAENNKNFPRFILAKENF